MAYPAIGLKSYLQFGLETVWGTAVAATRRVPVMRARSQPGASIIKSENMDGKLTRASMYQGPHVPRLSVTLESCNVGHLLLYDCTMGTQAYAAVGGSTTGAGPYTHVFKNEEFLNSLTLQLIEGNIPDAKCQRLVGGKVEELVLRCEYTQDIGAILTEEITFRGKTFATDQTPTGALTSATPTPWTFAHISTKDIGATATPTLRSFTFTLRNNLAERPNIGSLYMDEPVRGGFVEPSLEFTAEFQNKTAVDEFLNATQGSPQIVLTNSTNVLTLDMPKGYMTAHDHPIDGPGVIYQTFTWDAIDDAASPSSGVTITLVSASDTTIS